MVPLPINLPRTIEYSDGKVRMINQLLLPHKLEYIETSDWRRVAEAIKRMEIRGAPAIGVAAAMALALAARELSGKSLPEALRGMEEAAEALRSTRPTAVNLFWAINRVMLKVREAKTTDELVEIAEREALAIWREDEECNKRIGEIGEQLIEDGATVMTVCNAGSLATSYYGTATAPIYAAVERGKKVRVIALETRPYLQGARLTAWELSRAGVEVYVITDNQMGIVAEREGVSLVIVGADRITSTGYVANKIGTFPLALVAKELGIPFYVAAPTSTIDMHARGPQDFEIERRPAEELLYIFGKRIAPEGVDAIYYAFDVTPPKLITGIITEKGIAYPPYSLSLRKLVTDGPGH